MAVTRTTHCVHVQWTDYTRPILNYSGLFSTAMDGTALRYVALVITVVTIIYHGVNCSKELIDCSLMRRLRTQTK